MIRGKEQVIGALKGELEALKQKQEDNIKLNCECSDDEAEQGSGDNHGHYFQSGGKKDILSSWRKSLHSDDFEKLNLLIQQHQDINAPLNNQNKETWLHQAAREGKVLLVKALIELGADVHTQNENGSLPVHYAIASPFQNMATLHVLVIATTQINHVNNHGLTPLGLALRKDNFEAVEILLSHPTIKRDQPTKIDEIGDKGESISPRDFVTRHDYLTKNPKVRKRILNLMIADKAPKNDNTTARQLLASQKQRSRQNHWR